MKIGACGTACGVCRYYLGIRKPPCKGCTAGTYPAAQDFLEWLKERGFSCLVLECAIKNKVDYCIKCDKFPCVIHFRVGLPYSKKLLDFFKTWGE